jgi:transcriptional regulator with XRE-family HTH domain
LNLFGEHIKKCREEAGLPLRKVAAFLDIDQAILSKAERGIRKLNRQQVVQIAGFFEEPVDELLKKWLSDKITYAIGDEDLALDALKLAEEQLKYGKDKT